MTTDNRTNEPTPEQVEAAAIAFTCETHDEWERSPEPYKEMIREDMRAALVAAQGAAPVLPSSGVDVAKIESLILGRTATAGARAVAEWLKGQGGESRERDAALAVIARVRKYADERSVYAKTRNNVVGSWRIASDLYDILNVPIEEQAALDGAPEPEWEYSVGFNDPEFGWINDHADIHDSYEDARSYYSEPNWLVEDRVVRRRKAGPWMPVSGVEGGGE